MSRGADCAVSGSGDGGSAGDEILLFGVRVKVDPMRKSVSMNNLSQYEHPHEVSNTADVSAAGYVSFDEVVHRQSSGNRERKRGVPWTEDEHKLFLLGLQKVGKGDWRGISKNFVKTRTPTQVASHAQKYFLRQTKLHSRRRRSSLFDMTTESVTAIPMEEGKTLELLPPPECTSMSGSQMLPLPVNVSPVLMPLHIGNPMERLTVGNFDQVNPQPEKLPCPVHVLSLPNASPVMHVNLNQKSMVDQSPLALTLSLSFSSNQGQFSTNSAFQVMSSLKNGDSIISVS